jgi:hypothetical protein
MGKRGINLGCGTIIMPCPRPRHHYLIPEWLYTDPDIEWDNADRNEYPGVNKVLDLFDYPWHALESEAYDYAIASHIVEHIPHHIVWEGKFIPRHEEYQDGWYAWFGELRRIMKPGGQAWILCPYGFSNGGISDPTHTRYITLATWGYFNEPGENTPFAYRQHGGWKIDVANDIWWSPHEDTVRELKHRAAMLIDGKDWLDEMLAPATYQAALSRLNAITDICVRLEAV